MLTDEGYGDSVITVLGDLDSDTESRTEAVAHDWIGHHVPALNVICVACIGAAGRSTSLVAGLPDEAFDHDGQLTKRDLRASALAHLMPRPGELLWDVGAGAASIAIEWLPRRSSLPSYRHRAQPRSGEADPRKCRGAWRSWV